MRPGFDTELRDEPVSRSGPIDISTWFVVGPAVKGPLTSRLLVSGKDYTVNYGGRDEALFVPDSIETFFAEGGTRAYMRRIVGPAATKATHNLLDGTPAATLRVDAAWEGAWYNGLNVEITTADGEFSVSVTHDDDPDTVIAAGGPFATKADAVAFFANSDIIRLTSLVPNTSPVAATVNLAGGDDDLDGITDDDYAAGADSFSLMMGPGQVSFPGRTTAEAHAAVLAHCAARNRRGVLDVPDSPNVGTLTAAAAAQRGTLAKQDRYGALFGPWDIVPGVLPNTKRTVPPCARVAGTIARSDNATGNPNLPAAGDNGLAQFALDITQTFTDDEYTTLNDAGVNMSRYIFGNDLQVYGYRTLVDPALDPRWVEFSGSRTIMYATALARKVMATFAFDQIDGEGHAFSELEGSIRSVLLPLYKPMRALYGATPQDAFRVYAGSALNTPERVQNRELRVQMALKTSPFAEHVVTEIVRRLVTEEV